MNNKPQKIFSDNIEQGALDQFASAMELDCVVRGALMPDAHQGYSLPIGGVVGTDNMVFPSWVGFDIGCGMCAARLEGVAKSDIVESANDIFCRIYKDVPVGFKHHATYSAEREAWISTVEHTDTFSEVWEKKAGGTQLGTLGGGNHFIEIGYDETDSIWAIVHSGSRGIGHGIAVAYMRRASGDGKAREGHFGFAADSDDGREYIIDMNACLRFALANRDALLASTIAAICAATGAPVAGARDFINRNHNHAEFAHGMWIHRKGATHAEAGMGGVIPGNMRDGSLIVRGLGNPDGMWSSSHGAGRVLGRKEAKRVLDAAEFAADMDGIVARTDEEILDESPRAYKNIFRVMEEQKNLVEVRHHIRPIINVKG